MSEQTRRTVLKGIGVSAALAFGGAGVASARRPGESIVEFAGGLDDFSTLVAAVTEAGLAEALDGNRQFTVFAPNNAAFAASGITTDDDGNLLIAQGTLDLLAGAGLTLADVLLYHVAPGRRDAESVIDSDEIPTLFKEKIDVMVEDETVVLNDGQAAVIGVDNMTSNGIIHVINGVLLP